MAEDIIKQDKNEEIKDMNAVLTVKDKEEILSFVKESHEDTKRYLGVMVEEMNGNFKLFTESMGTKMDTLENKVDILQTDMTEVKDRLIVVETKVEVLQDDVSVLKEDVSVLKTDVSILKEDASALKEDVGSITKVVLNHDENIEDKISKGEFNLFKTKLEVKNI